MAYRVKVKTYRGDEIQTSLVPKRALSQLTLES
jgi:hypothetical protein